MVDRREVYKVCDKLRAAGRKVTYRAVQGALEEGGSFRDVGPELRRWKAERDYRPRLELADMPKEVRTKFEAFSVAAWKAVKDRAGSDLGRALVDKADLDEELLASLDARDARIRSLEAELRAKEAEAVALRRAAETGRAAAEARGEARANETAALALAKVSALEELVTRYGIAGGRPKGGGPEEAA
jgi:regulator of protease activity HflC (stomatin/prohibitin superfamily)